MKGHISPKSVLIEPNHGSYLVAGTLPVTALTSNHSSNHLDTQPEVSEAYKEEVALRRSKRLLEKQVRMGTASPTRVDSQSALVAELPHSLVVSVGQSRYGEAYGLAIGRHFEVANASLNDNLEECRLGRNWPSAEEELDQQHEVEGNSLTYSPNASHLKKTTRSSSLRQPKPQILPM